jgi:hypothetical protein
MSTRATITVADEKDSFDIYQHHDGYPDGPFGLVRHIAMARRLAWDLPRFEAADFAAAIIAVLKDRGGSTYLTKEAEAHCDRDFHYRIVAQRENCAARVMLTITRTSYERGRGDVEVFAGEIQEAVAKFNAVSETRDHPREWQILGEIEGALYRAEEEIAVLCGNRPDEDTEKVLEELDDAGRAVCRLRHHLDQNDPWATLTRLEGALERLRVSGQPVQVTALPSVDVKLAMDAHRRFQRD